MKRTDQTKKKIEKEMEIAAQVKAAEPVQKQQSMPHEIPLDWFSQSKQRTRIQPLFMSSEKSLKEESLIKPFPELSSNLVCVPPSEVFAVEELVDNRCQTQRSTFHIFFS